MKRSRFLFALATLVLVSSPAFAQFKKNVNTIRFVNAVNGKGLLSTEAGAILRHLDWTAGFVADYGYHPVVIFDRTTGKELRSLIDHRVMLNAFFAIGIVKWLEFGVNIPVMVHQTGGQLEDTSKKLRKNWLLGDPRLVVKVALLPLNRFPVDLSFQANVTFPVADPNSSIGEPNVSASGQFNLSYDGVIFAGINLGVLFRDQFTVKGIPFAHEFRLSGGLAYTIPEKLTGPVGVRFFAETYLSTPLKEFFKNTESTPVEVLGGVRLRLFNHFDLTAAVGGGVVRGTGTPATHVYFGFQYTTDSKDRDGDGIPDSVDKCPDDPEDKDGFEDSDGCPDPDNDKDGICDPWVAKKGLLAKYAHICRGSDNCPNEPEDKDGFEDEDGCPDPDNDKDGVCDPWVQKTGQSKKYHAICTGSDNCPNVAGPKENNGCPWGDRDGDGIKDNVDKCPDEPEDFDGFQDEDGCPDPDNDNDGVCDPWVAKKGQLGKYKSICTGSDRCPNVAGPKDNHGCPLVRLTGTRIEILQKVYFDTAKAKIKSVSFSLLAAVAKVLKDNPKIRLIEVGGHTDSRGSKGFNTRLSKRRAQSVVTHLVKVHGIDKKRLKFKGYGPSKPLVQGKGEAVWSQNRRVEFVILKRDK